MLEKAVPKYRRERRPFSMPFVPLGPSRKIWRTSRNRGALLRALHGLPRRIGRRMQRC